MQRIAGALVGITLIVMASPLALAAEPHEDPEAAKSVFSGISLLNYYTAALDFVLQLDPADVEGRLVKMPFANVPASLDETTQNFAAAGITVSQQVFEIDKSVSVFRELRAQSRLKEAIELANHILNGISLARSELDQLEKETQKTGSELNVLSAPEGSNLRLAYSQVLDRIERIRALLALYEELLKTEILQPEELLEAAGFTQEDITKLANLSLEELLKLTGLTLGELLKPTTLTLEIQPTEAFVGDELAFEGRLTFGNTPMAGREIVILLDSSRYATAVSDANGRYQGTMTVPLRYLPEMRLQALYSPQDNDIGIYLAALSPVVILKVLFYESELKLTLEDKAYPGLDTRITGAFSYGDAPLLKERRIEIYLDDVFMSGTMAQNVAFSRTMPIAPALELGEHVVTVSASGAGRYSPAVAKGALNVIRAVPILELEMPGIAIIPGSIGLKGRLYSEIGPLSGASVRIGLENSQVSVASAADGTFEIKIGTQLGIGLIGTQDLAIRVLPQEPWHESLVVTMPLLMINLINLAGIAVILIILGIYLPGVLRRKLGELPRRAVKPTPAPAAIELAPVYTESIAVPEKNSGDSDVKGEPRDIIFYWYRLAVKLLQKITRGLLGPSQTLREFARDSSAHLGPLARHFIELTHTVERLLYSPYRATEQDAENSKGIAHTIEAGLKDETV